MKTKFNNLFLILAFLNFSCENDNFSGSWISINQISYSKADAIILNDSIYGDYPILTPNENSLYVDTMERKQIFKFESDSIFITVFNDTYYDGYRIYSFSFKQKNDSLILNSNDEPFSWKVKKVKNKTLEISYHDDYNNHVYTDLKNILIPVKAFGQAVNRDKLNNMLTNNLYLDEPEGGIIEFFNPSWLHMGRMLYEDSEGRYSEYDDWYSMVFENELFLSIGGKLYQVIDFSEKGVKVFSYDEDVQIKIIARVQGEEVYNQNLLLGTWQRKIMTPKQAESYLTNTTEENNIDEIQFLPNEMIVSNIVGKDTINWRLNFLKEKIRVEPNFIWKYGAFWKIIKLDQNQLELERLNETSKCCEVEKMVFKKNR